LGTGKSHLAIALGVTACMQSRKVRFTTTAALVNELIEARDDRALSKIIARYSKVELLILDYDEFAAGVSSSGSGVLKSK
jgi:DNA replication protein DnaC